MCWGALLRVPAWRCMIWRCWRWRITCGTPRQARQTRSGSSRRPSCRTRVSLQLQWGSSIGIAAVSHDSPVVAGLLAAQAARAQALQSTGEVQRGRSRTSSDVQTETRTDREVLGLRVVLVTWRPAVVGSQGTQLERLGSGCEPPGHSTHSRPSGLWNPWPWAAQVWHSVAAPSAFGSRPGAHLMAKRLSA